MSEIRKQIRTKISSLGKNIENTHISELQNHKDLEKRVIRTDLLDFDYSKQLIRLLILISPNPSRPSKSSY